LGRVRHGQPAEAWNTLLSWPAEEEDVAVGVGDFEAAQAVVGVLERGAEGCAVRGEFGGERVGVGRVDKGV